VRPCVVTAAASNGFTVVKCELGDLTLEWKNLHNVFNESLTMSKLQSFQQFKCSHILMEHACVLGMVMWVSIVKRVGVFDRNLDDLSTKIVWSKPRKSGDWSFMYLEREIHIF
jgi:hypothetical protein